MPALKEDVRRDPVDRRLQTKSEFVKKYGEVDGTIKWVQAGGGLAAKRPAAGQQGRQERQGRQGRPERQERQDWQDWQGLGNASGPPPGPPPPPSESPAGLPMADPPQLWEDEREQMSHECVKRVESSLRFVSASESTLKPAPDDPTEAEKPSAVAAPTAAGTGAAAAPAETGASQHLRIDEADGQAYTFTQFVECYGAVEGPRRFGSSKVLDVAKDDEPGKPDRASFFTEEQTALGSALVDLLQPLGARGVPLLQLHDLYLRSTGLTLDPRDYGIRARCSATRMLLERPPLAERLEIACVDGVQTVCVKGARGGDGVAPTSAGLSALELVRGAKKRRCDLEEEQESEDASGPKEEMRLDALDGLEYTRQGFYDAYGPVDGERRWKRSRNLDDDSEPPAKRPRLSEVVAPLGVFPVSGQLGAVVEVHSLRTAELNGLWGVIFREQPPDHFVVVFPPPVGDRVIRFDKLKVVGISASSLPRPLEERRVDAADGRPYLLSQFLQAYGPDEAKARWEMSVPSQEREGDALVRRRRGAPRAGSQRELPMELGYLPMTETLVLVGEGNFSFAEDLCDKMYYAGMPSAANIVATAMDTERMAYEKYSDCRQSVEHLMSRGGKALFGVDATKPDIYPLIAEQTPRGRIDAVAFNFPHTGDKLGWDPGPEMLQLEVQSNKFLLELFFRALAVCPLTRQARVFVALRNAFPYNVWEIGKCARKFGWVMVDEVPFRLGVFPKYAFQHTIPLSTDFPGGPMAGIRRKKRDDTKVKDGRVHEFRFCFQTGIPSPGAAELKAGVEKSKARAMQLAGRDKTALAAGKTPPPEAPPFIAPAAEVQAAPGAAAGRGAGRGGAKPSTGGSGRGGQQPASGRGGKPAQQPSGRGGMVPGGSRAGVAPSGRGVPPAVPSGRGVAPPR
eukprot:TRINITY_DN5404_c1_g1_i1.p1 TRINITY_DN5404_c1_g1~~TRINITY_DN5404_c1_g1_i1.p1  ORF type:complete len:928 (+),score=222.55 TRINITY_DN5404_c1_g1_i1:61-2784(+)